MASLSFSVRTESTLVEALDALVKERGISRNEAITRLIEWAVMDSFIPLVPGEGLRATKDEGQIVVLTHMDNIVVSGQQGLQQGEMDVYNQAVHLATERQWHLARRLLINNGFSVEYTNP